VPSTSPGAPHHSAVLDALDRGAADHLNWLKRVHAALLFGDTTPLPAPDPPDALLAWAEAPDLSPTVAEERLDAVLRLYGAHHDMRTKAARLMDGAARGEAVSPADYEAFMVAVEDYGHHTRLVDSLLRQTLAETDPLTGVGNRLGMMRDLEREAQRAQRSGQPCCIAILDLDHFKAINDTYGHQAGDRVLNLAARFLVRRLRPYDRVYRYGGEEFLFCLPDTDLDKAARVLNRLRSLMARVPVPLGSGREVHITASIGVAVLASGTKALQTAIARADAALYAAKQAGRNRVIRAEDDRRLVPPLRRRPEPEDASYGLGR